MSKSGSFGEFSRRVTEAQLLSDIIAKLTEQEENFLRIWLIKNGFGLEQALGLCSFIYTVEEKVFLEW